MRLKRLDPHDARHPFSCGDADLDQFYLADSITGGEELLSVTYCLLEDARDEVLAFFAVSNDSIKKSQVPADIFNQITGTIPHEKQYSSMPAAKIGRLGVCNAAQRNRLGTAILDYLKYWFTNGNKTGCRFLIVDAYNTPTVLAFYERNGFRLLVPAKGGDHITRIMYFDLKRFGEESDPAHN